MTIAAQPAYEDTEVKAREQQVREFAEARKPKTGPTQEEIEAQQREQADRQARHKQAEELRTIARDLE